MTTRINLNWKLGTVGSGIAKVEARGTGLRRALHLQSSDLLDFATVPHVIQPATVLPNPSLHPGPATAGVVSPACASGSIVTRRAYNTCLRGPGELER